MLNLMGNLIHNNESIWEFIKDAVLKALPLFTPVHHNSEIAVSPTDHPGEFRTTALVTLNRQAHSDIH